MKFEEGQDIFSRYLPFAIAFGVADKWAKKFEELAKHGVKVANPAWYGNGSAFGAYTFWSNTSGFGDQLTQFASLADSAMSAPTPGSSGGSGFSSSGGGGFSGGGGGGGGGGGW